MYSFHLQVSGAKTQELNGEISRLVRLLNTERYKDVKDDWKLITLFIGANNVCVLCEPPMTTLPGLADADIFEDNVRNVLERIRTDVGKSFVNLVALFNVSSGERRERDSFVRLMYLTVGVKCL